MTQYGTKAKAEAESRLMVAAERGNIYDLLRWNLIERAIGALEALG